MIIDAHMHLGECRVFNLNITEQEIIDNMDRAAVHASIVQPYPGAPDARRVHDRIANLAARNPGRIFGICSLSPHIDRVDYEREVERCVRDLKFVAVKMHTIGHAVNPITPDGATVFEVADALGIPTMVHTGPGVPFALPSMLVPYAVKYPGMKIIIAHAGFGIYSSEAVVLAEQFPNLYLEPSWCLTDEVGWMISAVGPRRVMLGSDSLLNLHTEIAKFRALNLAPAVFEQVTAKTAIEVFNLPLA